MKSETYIQKAYRCILQNDFEEALRWFEEAIQANPGDAEVHYRCSITYGRSNRLEMAISHAEEAVRLQPDKPEYTLHLQHIKAAELVQKARKMVEGRTDVTKSELYQAVSHLKSAVAMDPLYAQAYVWLALVYSELNEHAMAIATLREVIALYPQESSLQHIMEELKQRLKSYLQEPASDGKRGHENGR
ncbi:MULTISPECIES: tetratricopeptide repeat protein [Paenibacillus]|uniref:Tetratricopeptide TPR_1 repeat-containing protein n=2 Tax=Paenibacillus lactis TaxID=228574 RepID=G4HFB9_9BACL|nr:tetratricopeptide repeat protein [Paenibacillus lactis]EHB64436.1 Tetratricopeptide TPR_1 repeat-containing protein [Paenibacillus lactis 154]MBP1892867.1 tetratricopeptide (TPR) repeat protein [Paenibacillus lactis]HAF97658.1 tetratricopeptide repeat protein [Paenibacillus lactis]